MEVIINDFSLDGQFKDVDEFLDSLYEVTLPMLKNLDKLCVNIIRSYYSYDSKVTNDKTLNDILITRGNPEITKLKGQLQKLFFEEPYWEDSLKAINEIYECNHTDKKSRYCLAEALERDIPVISFEHNKFKESTIEIKKNNKSSNINNLFNNEILLQIFREYKIISHFNYIILKYSLNESFGFNEGKNYFDELIKDATLSDDDIEIIVNDIEKLIVLTNTGENPGRLSDTFDNGLKEFRTSLSNRREIRIFYFEKNNKLVFMNGFLKKDQKTPTLELDRAKRIMKTYI